MCDPLPGLLVWLGVELRVGRDWDMLRHALDPLKGSVSIADRRRQRLQAMWTQCRKRPDMNRMIREYEKRQGKRDEEAVFEPLDEGGGWRGLHRRFEDGTVLTRAMRYFEPYERLIELTLNWHSQREGEADLPGAVMRDCRLAEAAVGAKHWRAFGLDFRLPELEATVRRGDRPRVLKPFSVRAEPGDTEFRFASEVQKKGGKEGGREPGGSRTVEVWVRRLGMAGVWYEGDAGEVLRTREPRIDFEVVQESGGVAAASVEAGPRVKRWVGRLRHRRDRLWLDRGSDAVLWVTTLSPGGGRGVALDPADVPVESWW